MEILIILSLLYPWINTYACLMLIVGGEFGKKQELKLNKDDNIHKYRSIKNHGYIGKKKRAIDVFS